jgi:hypothetical protein
MLVQVSIVSAVISILILYVIIIKKTKTLPQVLILFIIQVIISQLVYALYGLVEDEKTYHATGLKLMNSLNAGEGYQNFGVGPGKQSFTYILGTIYFWFGPYPILGMLANAFIMSINPPILVLACKNLGLTKIAGLSSWIFVLTPSLMFWAPGLRRESLAFALILLSILAISLIFRSKFVSGSILTLIIIYIIQTTRQPLLLILLPGLISAFLLRPSSTLMTKLIQNKNSFINLCITIVIVISHGLYLLQRFFNQSSTVNAYLKEVSNPKFSTSILGTSWETNSSPTGYLYNIYRALTGPPIWEWNSISMLVFGIEGISYFLIMLIVLWSVKKFNFYRRPIVVLISSSVPLLLISSLVLANYGINSRVRAHYLIPLLPIIALFLNDFVTQMMKKRNLKRIN